MFPPHIVLKYQNVSWFIICACLEDVSSAKKLKATSSKDGENCIEEAPFCPKRSKVGGENECLKGPWKDTLAWDGRPLVLWVRTVTLSPSRGSLYAREIKSWWMPHREWKTEAPGNAFFPRKEAMGLHPRVFSNSRSFVKNSGCNSGLSMPLAPFGGLYTQRHSGGRCFGCWMCGYVFLENPWRSLTGSVAVQPSKESQLRVPCFRWSRHPERTQQFWEIFGHYCCRYFVCFILFVFSSWDSNCTYVKSCLLSHRLLKLC